MTRQLKFEARDNRGNNRGDYEMFLDLTSTSSNPTNLVLTPSDMCASTTRVDPR